MKVVILPLDSRPCTRDFPAQLALGGGLQPVIPPLDRMDWFRTPSDFSRISAWLREACQGAGALICSLDQLAYGGLLASRTGAVSLEQAEERVDFLRELKREYPGLSLYLSSVIMRITVSTLRQEDQIWWEKVAQYSQLSAQTGREAADRRLQLEREIPAPVLQTFLAVRRRNHRVNQRAVELVADGTACHVCFLQEDSAPQGIHRVEQQELWEQARALGVASRMDLHCGTDEYACALVGRLAAEQGQTPGPALRLYVEWLAGDTGFTARYEDRPFAENLKGYLRTCHICPVDRPEDGQAILAVYAPPGPQTDLVIGPRQAVCAYPPEQVERCAERLKTLLDSEKPVGLLDVYHANGGEGCLLTCAARKGLLSRLSAYAGWNTASNALGTILGQLLADHAGAGPAAEEHLTRFTRERLLDDWVYQAVVRPAWNEELRGRGLDIWDLSGHPLLDAELQQRMEAAPETHQIWQGPFRARLCWPRTFEAHIAIQEGANV